MKLGHYSIDTSDVIALGWTYGRSQYKELFKHSEFVAPDDRDGTWTFDSENHMLRRIKIEGEETVGDLKVTYEAIDGFTADKGMVVSAIGT